MNKRILLACPVSDYKQYIIDDWLAHIRKLVVPNGYNMDFLFVDNSANIQFSRMLTKKGFNVVHIIRHKNENLNELMCRCLNYIQKQVKDGGYDYFFSLECDVFPPVDVLKRLLDNEKDVVSACYNIEGVNERHLMVQYPKIIDNEKCDVFGIDFKTGFDLITGKLIKVLGCGIGCTLIKSSVIEDYTFRVIPGLQHHADTFFYLDLYNRGFESWLDTSVFCYHYNSNWHKIMQRYDRKRTFRSR